MERLVKLGPRFYPALDRCGVPKDPAKRKAVAAVLKALGNEDVLPGPFDQETLIPPVRRAIVRRVGGFNLWLFYVVVDDQVVVINLTNQPPIPID